MSRKYRAVIIGCGRMGAGRDHSSPWIYTHPEAYRAMPGRVEIVGFVDRVLARAQWAAAQWNVGFAGDNVAAALEHLCPDVVSICTPPSDRFEIVKEIDSSPSIRGVWCEKPYTLKWIPFRRDGSTEMKVQVNYIRRFDQRHIGIRNRRVACESVPVFDGRLIVISANDIHTTSHFTDLAEFWQIPKEKLQYVPYHGPSLYILREPGPDAGRYLGWRDEAFVGGGVETGFMEAALGNLLDALDGTAELISPADGVFKSETWADEIVQGRSNLL